MSITVVAQIFDGGVPQNGLADDPEITIIRNDTNAIVAGPVAMVDGGVGGLYNFVFTPTVFGLSYSYSIDADPNVTGQVSAAERFYGGAFDDELDELYRIRGLDSVNKTVDENAENTDYDEEELGNGAPIRLSHVKTGAQTVVTRT